MNKINSISGNAPLYNPFDEPGSGGGGSWNEPTSRRRFLKRTGAASAATFIAWHATGMRSYADPAEDPPVEIVVDIPAGSTVTFTTDIADPSSLAGATVTKRDKLKSGESFTGWSFSAQGKVKTTIPAEGPWTVEVTGPGKITFTRSKKK